MNLLEKAFPPPQSKISNTMTPTQQPLHFIYLPLEIWIKIFSYLPPPPRLISLEVHNAKIRVRPDLDRIPRILYISKNSQKEASKTHKVILHPILTVPVLFNKNQDVFHFTQHVVAALESMTNVISTTRAMGLRYVAIGKRMSSPAAKSLSLLGIWHACLGPWRK